MNIKKFLFHNSIFPILILAAILRIWQLGSLPPSLTPDEAALGYNAYSILKTGRDEYGKLLPVIFKSFGDYKPGFYIYTTVPFIAIFGLTEFAVRLPSAIAGVIAVWLMYLIVKKIRLKNILEIGNPSTSLGKVGLPDCLKLEIIGSSLLAINPGHIHFSRGAWEANLALTLTLFGIYFFLKALDRSKFLILASVFFSLTVLTYQGAKLSTLIVIFVLIVSYWQETKAIITNNLVTVIQSTIVGLIIVLPVLISFHFGQTGRLNVFNVFSYPRPKEYLQTFLDQGNEKVGSLNYYLFHSEPLNYKRGIMSRWFNHFSGRFLFFEGDWQNPRHSAPNHGMLLLSDIILLVIGFNSIIRKSNKFTYFILLWLLLAPLPAVLSRDQVHAIRSLNMVIPLTFLSSFGLIDIFGFNKNLSNNLKKFSFISFISILFVGSLVYYLDSYFIHLSKHNSKLWEYGYKQMVEIVTPIQKNYTTVKVQQSFAQPYIYFLFYQKYQPAIYQKKSKLVDSGLIGDVGYVNKLDNIEFVPIDWSLNRGDSGSLIIGDSVRIPPQDSSDTKLFTLINEIKYLNGETAFRMIEIK